MLVFWILRFVDICTPGTAFPCTVGARVLPSIYARYIYIYTHICALAKPSFCSGGRISRKPKKGALLSTRSHSNHDSKSLITVHCLVPVLIATMITKVLVTVWIY